MEINDTLLEIYSDLDNHNETLKGLYLKLISSILSSGVSLSKNELFYKIFSSSQDFQQAILNVLESENLPLSLCIDRPYKGPLNGYLFTYPFKSDSKGFTLTFWVKYHSIQPTSCLFEITSSNERESLLSYNYIVSPPVTLAAGASSSSLSKKEEDSSLGSARVSKDDVTKYFISIDVQGNATKIELPGPLLEENTFTHFAIHYSKVSHFCYANGKLVHISKQGSANPYPMSSFKTNRLRFTAQEKIISIVSVFSGQLEYETIMRLWLRGPIEESESSLKELGIIQQCRYRFPHAIPIKAIESPYEKLNTEQGISENESQSEIYKLQNLVARVSNVQAQYTAKLHYFPDNEFVSPSTKELKNPELFETYGPIRVNLNHTHTLKEFLSTEEFIKIILTKLSPENKIPISDNELSVQLRILERLLIRNGKFTELVKERVNTVLLSLAVSQRQNTTDIEVSKYAILSVFINLMCNHANAIRELNVYTKPPLLSIPVLHNTRMENFKYIRWIALDAAQDQKECLLNVLANLLQRQENMEKLAGSGLQITLINMFRQTFEKRSDSNMFAYEKLLEIFQLLFYWHHTLDWELLFTFFLSLDNSEGINRPQDVLADLLSILSIYIHVKGSHSGLAEKFTSKDGMRVYISFYLIFVDYILSLEKYEH